MLFRGRRLLCDSIDNKRTQATRALRQNRRAPSTRLRATATLQPVCPPPHTLPRDDNARTARADEAELHVANDSTLHPTACLVLTTRRDKDWTRSRSHS